jgi:hypothetical protein
MNDSLAHPHAAAGCAVRRITRQTAKKPREGKTAKSEITKSS